MTLTDTISLFPVMQRIFGKVIAHICRRLFVNCLQLQAHPPCYYYFGPFPNERLVRFSLAYFLYQILKLFI